MTLVEMMNPFTGKKAGDMPDEQHVVQTSRNPLVDKVASQFHEICDTFGRTYGGIDPEDWYVKLLDVKVPVLEPDDINAVANSLYTTVDSRVAQFITRLVQVAYGAGKNDFKVANVEQNRSIFYRLRGDKEGVANVKIAGLAPYGTGTLSRRCEFRVWGDADDCVGQDSTNVSVIIDGDVGSYHGWGAVKSTFIVRGDAGPFIGAGSNECKFFVNGSVGKSVGYCRNGTFIINGRIDPDFGRQASKCTFLTQNPESLRQLQECIPAHNYVGLIDRLPDWVRQ